MAPSAGEAGKQAEGQENLVLPQVYITTHINSQKTVFSSKTYLFNSLIRGSEAETDTVLLV